MDQPTSDHNAYWKLFGKPEPGSRLPEIPTLDGILEADAQLAGDGAERPVPLRRKGDIHPEPRLITYARYIDPAFVQREIDHIWKTHWQVACREEDIPEVGDWIAYDIIDKSYIVSRTGPNEFKAVYNSCRHRGRKLCHGKGHSAHFQCPFHGWVFGLDGKLEWIPFEEEFPHANAANHSLVPVQVANWGGNVFINPDPACEPLERTLGILMEHFAPYPQEQRYTAMRVLVNVRCNWKAAQEAFMEAYHVVETHADGMPVMGSVATQIDIWSDGKGYVSRLCTPGMSTDPYIADRVSVQDAIALYCNWHELPQPPADWGNSLPEARRWVANEERKRLEANTGRDYSAEPISTFLDMAKYFMFPNFHPWWGEGIPWWYNFKPHGRDPDSCQMELRVLLPIPADGTRPAVPDAILVDFDEKAGDNPALGGLGHIIDQDLDNMTAVQEGFKAAADGADYLTTSVTQEAKIRHFHGIYDRLLGLED